MEVFGGASRSTASSGGFSPMQAPGCRFTWYPRLLLLELLPPSGSGCGSFRCPSCSFHPAPAWFSSETSASWVLTVASAPDSERTFAFGRSLCLPPIFSLSFSLWGRRHSWVNGQGAGGVLPIGLFPLSALGLPASALAVAGKGGSILRAHPVFRTVAWCLFKSLLFPSYATRCRYDVPGVLASGSGLVASACGYACGRCLRIALGSGAGFPFVSLPCGRVV